MKDCILALIQRVAKSDLDIVLRVIRCVIAFVGYDERLAMEWLKVFLVVVGHGECIFAPYFDTSTVL